MHETFQFFDEGLHYISLLLNKFHNNILIWLKMLRLIS